MASVERHWVFYFFTPTLLCFIIWSGERGLNEQITMNKENEGLAVLFWAGVIQGWWTHIISYQAVTQAGGSSNSCLASTRPVWTGPLDELINARQWLLRTRLQTKIVILVAQK